MKSLITTLKRMFNKKADIVVYRDGKVYKFKTMTEAHAYASK